MTPVLVALVTFVVTAAIVGLIGLIAGRLCFNDREQIDERLNAINTKIAAGTGSGLFKGLNRKEKKGFSWRTWAEECVEQAGIHATLKGLVATTAVIASLLAFVAMLVNGSWWVVMLAGLGGSLVVPIYVRAKRQRRMVTLFRQLPQALELITRAVTAGQTVPAAFRLVAEELESPISTDFRNCYERQNLGMSFDTSLRALARRTGIVELQILAVVLLVQSRTGGNLVDLLGELTTTVYKRLKFQQRVRALTSEGRLQAAVLIVLPTCAFIGLHFLSPSYVRTLHEHPRLIGLTVLAQLLGALWIRQCLKCDY
jgi:tight adherence protein B